MGRKPSRFSLLSRADYDRMDFSSLAACSIPGRMSCVSGEGEEPLFLRRYSSADLERFLKETGFISRVERMGYKNLLFSVECDPEVDGIFRIYADSIVAKNLLIDLRVSERRFIPPGRESSPRVYDMVHIEWFNSRDPHRSFSPSHMRLPGQDTPGLGALSSFMSIMNMLGRELRRDGFLAIPDHLYAALMYGSRFHFFDPEMEGTIFALRRDMRNVSLGDIAWADPAGAIKDIATGGVFVYEPSFQIAPLSGRMTRYFRSGDYRKKAMKAYREHGFVLDRRMLEHPVKE